MIDGPSDMEGFAQRVLQTRQESSKKNHYINEKRNQQAIKSWKNKWIRQSIFQDECRKM